MRLIVLDRDGVINEDSDDYIKSVDEFRLIPGSAEAIARLNQAGYRVAVATNQSGLARGYFDLDTLNAIHAKLRQTLAAVGGHVDLILFCPHGPDDACRCRKPLPGLLQEIGERMGVSLENVPAVGDSLRDLEAARAVSARPILVQSGKGMRTLEQGKGLEGVPVYKDLAEAVEALVSTN